MGFRWPHRWPIIAKDAFDPALMDHDEHGFSHLFVAEQDDRDRYLEDYLDTLPTGGGKRFATKVVAASNSVDHSSGDYDSICTATDDGSTISAAFTASGTSGGTVLLMEGDYYIDTASITVPANCALVGMGPGTVIHIRGGVSAVKVTGSSTQVRALQIVGTNATGQVGVTVGTASTQYSVLSGLIVLQAMTGVAVPSANCSISDCVVQSCLTVGISVTGDDCLICNCKIAGCGGTGAITGGGVYINGPSTSVTGCDFNGNNPGIYIDNVTGASVTGNTSTTDRGFIVVNPATGATDITIVGNCLDNPSVTNGITATFLIRSIIASNTVPGSAQHGISLTSCTDTVVSGNVVSSSGGAAGNTYDDIIAASCTNLNLRDNICRSNATTKSRYGINVNGTGNSRTVMVGNDLHDANWGTGAFSDTGTGTIKNLDGSANNWNLL